MATISTTFPACCRATTIATTMILQPSGIGRGSRKSQKTRPLREGRTSSEPVTLLAENRLGHAPQVASEDLFALGPRQVGVENLGQLGGVGSRRSVSAPHEPVHPYLASGE